MSPALVLTLKFNGKTESSRLSTDHPFFLKFQQSQRNSVNMGRKII